MTLNRQRPRNANGRVAGAAKREKKVKTPIARMRKLNKQLVELREENAMLRKNLIALLHEDVPVDRTMLLKQAALGPSIVDIVNAMDRHGD